MSFPPEQQQPPPPPSDSPVPNVVLSTPNSPLPKQLDLDSPEASQTSEHYPPGPPNFSPFFTLIEDARSGTYHHPTVHYVFADDSDSDLITAASLRALGSDATAAGTSSPSRSRRHRHQRHLSRRNRSDDDVAVEDDDDEDQEEMEDQEDELDGALPPPTPGVQDRYIIIELAADGQTVLSSRSLSGDWAVTSTHVGPAPMLGAEIADGEVPDAGENSKMLRIVGTGLGSGGLGGGGKMGDMMSGEQILAEVMKEMGNDDMVGGMEELVGRIRRDMAVLDKVVGSEPS